MNINDVFPTLQLSDTTNSPHLWIELLERRKATATGFATLEAKQGLLKPKVSFSSSTGQDMLRIICFRVLEEAAESYMSQELAHVKEEAIDSLNYLLWIPLLDEEMFPIGLLAAQLYEIAERTWKHKNMTLKYTSLTLADLGVFTFTLGGKLADTFRNRAWMNHTQDPYFSGDQQVKDALEQLVFRLLVIFDSFEDFLRYFIAKDEVLQFRLRSLY